jgi:hypothetical protein
VTKPTRVAVHTWFERDRSHVEVRNADTQETLIEWWDEDCMEAFADGFLVCGYGLRDSAVAYAEHLGAIKAPFVLVGVDQ